jgi:hypothetical protein
MVKGFQLVRGYIVVDVDVLNALSCVHVTPLSFRSQMNGRLSGTVT